MENQTQTKKHCSKITKLPAGFAHGYFEPKIASYFDQNILTPKKEGSIIEKDKQRMKGKNYAQDTSKNI